MADEVLGRVPQDLTLQLIGRFDLEAFVETGTYTGATAAWAAEYFTQVITIEYSQTLYERAVADHGELDNISFIFGDSRSKLKKIVSELNHSALFWLDSHWCGADSYGEEDECPLIEEIQAIRCSEYEHFIFIDDARLFLSPPHRPHNIKYWPTLWQIMSAIQVGEQDYYITIHQDVILAVPNNATAILSGWLQEENTQSWLQEQKRLAANAGPDAPPNRYNLDEI